VSDVSLFICLSSALEKVSTHFGVCACEQLYLQFQPILTIFCMQLGNVETCMCVDLWTYVLLVKDACLFLSYLI